MSFNAWSYILAAVCIMSAILLIWVIAYIAYRLLQWRRVLLGETVLFELTPPAGIMRTPRATQELFNVLHGLKAARSRRDKLLRRNVVLAFEISSTRTKGIRYLLQVEKRSAASVRQAVTSYLPQIKVTDIKDDLPDTFQEVAEFKQAGHYAFPFAFIGSLEQHDPVAYLAGAMSNLSTDENIRLQIILTPIRPREAAYLSRKILANEDLLTHLSNKKLPALPAAMRLVNSTIFATTGAIGEIYHGSTKQNSYDSAYGNARTDYERMQVSTRRRPARTLSAFELKLVETMHKKLKQPLFRASIRVAINMRDVQESKARLASLKTSLQSYNVPSYQELHTRANIPILRNLRQFAFSRRLPAFLPRHSLILSSSELGGIYHFPVGNTAQTDNLITSLSRTLPAPVSLKQNMISDVIIGENRHHNTITPISLTPQERERHQYIIGGTGNGKTTLLQYQIVQDMMNDKGLAVIDPHGDMAETLLRHVPERRIDDVVYFNPDDLEYPIGLNLLELTPGLTGNELLREKDIITESVVSVFRKIFSEEDTGGHRIEYVLRNTIQTALTVPDATLFTVFDLLNDPKYRKSVIKTLEDKNLINFWKNELGKAGEMQKVKMAAGITAKIGRFLFSASARQILEQPKSTIDFDDIINSGKLLICNFSKGLLGEDTSELFGITVLAKLQLASLRRARLKQDDRRAFYLYVDEFQNFATQSFVQMLSESRKYKLFMVMAEQSTSQQKDQQMVNIILANVGTVICFRTGNPQDEKLLLPLFSPYINEGEISNLPTFNFYARLSAINTQEPLSGQTLLLPDLGNEKIASQAIDRSRQIFARRQIITEEQDFKSKTHKRSNKKSKIMLDV